MNSIGYFNTARLKVRQLTAGDLDDVVSLYQAPLVAQTKGGLHHRAHIVQSLEGHLEHWDTYNFGYYVFEDKATESFIGKGGLRRCVIDNKQEVDLDYALLPEYWDQGFAPEIMKKLIDIAFRKLQLTSIVSCILADNETSKRILEKNGFIFEKQIDYKDAPHALYRLTPHLLKTFLSWR